MFSVDGVTRKDNSIDLRLRILLSRKLREAIPKNIREFALKEEDEGKEWAGTLIGITGNYKSPSMRFLSDQFSLDLPGK